MIEKQAKEIEMKQLQEQKSKEKTSGEKPKISKAAAALNNDIMGKKEENSQD